MHSHALVASLSYVQYLDYLNYLNKNIENNVETIKNERLQTRNNILRKLLEINKEENKELKDENKSLNNKLISFGIICEKINRRLDTIFQENKDLYEENNKLKSKLERKDNYITGKNTYKIIKRQKTY